MQPAARLKPAAHRSQLAPDQCPCVALAWQMQSPVAEQVPPTQVEAPHVMVQLPPYEPSAQTEHVEPAQLPAELERVHAHVPSDKHWPCPEHLPGHTPLHVGPKYPAAHARQPVPAVAQKPRVALSAHASHHWPAQLPCVRFAKHVHVPALLQVPFLHATAHPVTREAMTPASPLTNVRQSDPVKLAAQTLHCLLSCVGEAVALDVQNPVAADAWHAHAYDASVVAVVAVLLSLRTHDPCPLHSCAASHVAVQLLPAYPVAQAVQREPAQNPSPALA